MRGNVEAYFRRLGDGRTDFVFSKLLLARIGAGEARPLACADLDHVRALRDQRTSRLGNAIRPAQLTVDRVAELRVDLVERDARLRPDVPR